jgi:hypothetical protein
MVAQISKHTFANCLAICFCHNLNFDYFMVKNAMSDTAKSHNRKPRRGMVSKNRDIFVW